MPTNMFQGMPGSLDFFDPTDYSAFQHDLNAVRMRARVGQYSADDAFRELSAALILLLHHQDFGADMNIASFCSVHKLSFQTDYLLFIISFPICFCKI